MDARKTGGRVVPPVVLIPSAGKPLAVLLSPACVVIERMITGGGILVAGRVTIERNSTGGRVGVAGRVVKERFKIRWPC